MSVAGQTVWPQYRGTWRGEARSEKPLYCAGVQRFNTTLAAGGSAAGSVLVHQKYVMDYQAIEGEEIVTKHQYKEYIYCLYSVSGTYYVKALDAESGNVEWTHTVDTTKFTVSDSDSITTAIAAQVSGWFIYNDRIYIPFTLAGKKLIDGIYTSVKYLAVGAYCLDLDGNYYSSMNALFASGTSVHKLFGDRWCFATYGGWAEYDSMPQRATRAKDATLCYDLRVKFYSSGSGGTGVTGTNTYWITYNVVTNAIVIASAITFSGIGGFVIGLGNSEWCGSTGGHPVTFTSTATFRTYANVEEWNVSGVSYLGAGSCLSFETGGTTKQEHFLLARTPYPDTGWRYRKYTNKALKWSHTQTHVDPACVYFYTSILTGTVPIFVVSKNQDIESWSDEAYTGVGVNRNWTQTNSNLSSQGHMPCTDGWGIYMPAGLGVIGYSLDGTLLFEYLPGSTTILQEVSLGNEYLYCYIYSGGNLQVHAVTSSEGLENLDIQAIDPEDTATDVDPRKEITVTFTGIIDYTTITTDSVKILNEAAEELAYTVISTVDYELVLKPTAALPLEEIITLQFSTDIKDIEGNSLHEAHTFTFTVAAAATFSVESFEPGNGAFDVALNEELVVTFSSDLDSSTLSTTACSLKNDANTAVPYTSVTSGDTLALTPSGGLATGMTYTLTLATTLENTDGVALDQQYTFSFSTGTVDLEEDDLDGDVYIESPDTTYSEWTDIILVPPRIGVPSGSPQWRQHVKVLCYSDAGHTSLLDTKSSEDNPELFSYSADSGVTWRAFPSLGLPAVQYQAGVMVKVRIKTGRGTTAYLVPYVGAEEA